ncbi:GNAT family N-acetyltransferase [Rapidithrix thailandica]|uniref:GNAT family N-acetyltransferase n=1 Tax=Rapidithrix thailandica TaxID=413964 RepID=A0AAW9RX66_9BACT
MINIRNATLYDLDTIQKMWLDLHAHHNGQHYIFEIDLQATDAIRASLTDRLKQKNERCFLAEKGAEILGIIFVSITEDGTFRKFHQRGYIAETFVKDEYRSDGVGRLLYNHAKNWLLEKGADHIELQVSVKNRDAIRFWEDQGFTAATEHMIYKLKK